MQWGLAPQQEYLVGPSYSLSHSMQFGRSRNTQHVAARHAQVRQAERAYTRVRSRVPDDSGWKWLAGPKAKQGRAPQGDPHTRVRTDTDMRERLETHTPPLPSCTCAYVFLLALSLTGRPGGDTERRQRRWQTEEAGGGEHIASQGKFEKLFLSLAFDVFKNLSRKKKKESRQPKGGMGGGRHAATIPPHRDFKLSLSISRCYETNARRTTFCKARYEVDSLHDRRAKLASELSRRA